MASKDKLIEKLKNGSIDANELRTLFKMVGGELKRTKGSHEQWLVKGQKFTACNSRQRPTPLPN